MKKCSAAAGPFRPDERRCDFCGKDLVGRRKRWCSDPCSKKWWTNHVYRMARKAAKRRDGYRCVKCGSRDKLEVNHIKPCLGAHAKKGCWHHLDNLETLCHEHHLEETKRQREAGMFDKRKTKRKRSR